MIAMESKQPEALDIKQSLQEKLNQLRVESKKEIMYTNESEGANDITENHSNRILNANYHISKLEDKIYSPEPERCYSG